MPRPLSFAPAGSYPSWSALQICGRSGLWEGDQTYLPTEVSRTPTDGVWEKGECWEVALEACGCFVPPIFTQECRALVRGFGSALQPDTDMRAGAPLPLG